MPHKILKKRIRQHQHFFKLNRHLLQKLVAEGQQPEALFIACSDSRIMAESMLGLKAGDYFVHRNIAACVPPSENPDLATTAVLEYAVIALQVKHIIVCGHTDCGGIKTLDTPPENGELPAIAQWLSYIEPARQDIDADSHNYSASERHLAIVERHVVRQLDNLRSYDFVKSAETQGNLELHGWVKYLEHHTLRQYDPQSGQFEA